MVKVTVSLDAADAIKRIPYICWLGPHDDPNGFPNFPTGEDPFSWDGNFGSITLHLLNAIGADPSKVPLDASGVTREQLIQLYPLPEEPSG